MNYTQSLNNYLQQIDFNSLFEEFEYINCGGCGWFAYNFVTFLEELGFYDYKIVATNKPNYKEQAPHHILVQIGNYYYDGEGCFEYEDVEHWLSLNDFDENDDDEFVELNKGYLKKAIKNSSIWNSTFNWETPDEDKQYILKKLKNVLHGWDDERKRSS